VNADQKDHSPPSSRGDSGASPIDHLSSEDERLIRLLEQSASLPEHVRELLIQRILTPTHEREAERSEREAKPLLNRLLSARPSHLIESVTQRVDHYRAERVEQVKNEWRRLVDRVDLQGEVQRLLSQLSIDVTLSIRLVPKEGATLGMTPKVETKAKLNIRPSEEADQSETTSSTSDKSTQNN
jgi:hypothetical protein